MDKHTIEYDNLVDEAFVMVRRDKCSLDVVKANLRNKGLEDADIDEIVVDVQTNIIKAKRRIGILLIVVGVLFILSGVVRIAMEQQVGLTNIVLPILGITNIILGTKRMLSASKDID